MLLQFRGVKNLILLKVAFSLLILGFLNFQAANGQRETLPETVTRLSQEVEELKTRVQVLENLLNQFGLEETAESGSNPASGSSGSVEKISFNVEVTIAPPEGSLGIDGVVNHIEFDGSEMRMLITLNGPYSSNTWPTPKQPEDIYFLDERANQYLFIKTTLPANVNPIKDVTPPYQFWIYFERPAIESGIYTFYYLGGTATFALTSENRVADGSTQ